MKPGAVERQSTAHNYSDSRHVTRALSQLVHELVQALLGLPVLGLLTRRPVRPSVGTDARVIDPGARASRHGFMDVCYAPIATKFCLAPK